MIILQDITYIHPNKDILFTNINLIVNKQDKIALIGNNGVGKSTLLRILSGTLTPSNGNVKTSSTPYYLPQIFGQFNHYSIAQALQIDKKINALNEILKGNVTDQYLTILDDDWTIEERCKEAFSHWGIDNLDLTKKIETLSGGQKTKVFLAGILLHRPEIVLLDEPSNHLDTWSRNKLYDYIQSTKNTLITVSHDRTLLNLLETVQELNKQGIKVYGGNYNFYATQKEMEYNTLNHELKNREKALKKAKDVEREAAERKQKLDARGKKKQEKAGLPTIIMNTLKNSAEKSASKIKNVHIEKVASLSEELTQLRKTVAEVDKMKIGFGTSSFYKGKNLIDAKAINFGYDNQLLWSSSLNFQINSGARVVIKGENGSGKTTLIKMILNIHEPTEGILKRADYKAIYIDQDYSLIDNTMSVYEQAQQYNSGELQEHEIKTILNRFLFTKAYWDKSCKVLSGGEKMRLMLCALTMGNKSPDMIILDEPTNNLDIQNIEILTDAINEYHGTLLIVTHDEYFLKQIHTEQTITVQ
jgi:ATPase subunit of ABC transporter with duplicated ATPase domains